MPISLILDVDTGTDDAVAIMLAALHPGLDLVGVTTVNGNVPLELTTDNTVRVLDHIGASVPVHSGQSRPLVRAHFPVPREDPLPGRSEVHGWHLPLPPATSAVAGSDAVEWLVETYRAATQPITLVPTGPLTNIATALTLEPRLAGLIPEMVVMGGAHETGNVTPTAEFNIWADPEAARIVLGAGVRTTLVTLDATHQALVSLDDCAAFDALGTPAATATADFVRTRIRGYDDNQPMSRAGAAPVHDALCVAALVDRSLITTRPCYVDVETHGELTVGMTVIDVAGRAMRPPNADVAFAADERGFVDLLMSTFG